MGTKNIKFSLQVESNNPSANTTVAITGGDTVGEFSLPYTSALSIPETGDGTVDVVVPITVDDVPTSGTIPQFLTRNFSISVSGGQISVYKIYTDHSRFSYENDQGDIVTTSSGPNYVVSMITEEPLWDGEPDYSRYVLTKTIDPVTGNVTFAEGLGVLIIRDGETCTFTLDVDYYWTQPVTE
jgi:hypothetical protein